MIKNRKIAIILLLVVLLPAMFFFVYEIGSLNRNEKIFKEIYNNQLDVIILSVNTYSQDVASSWEMKLNTIFTSEPGDLNSSLKRFTYTNPSIRGIFYFPDTTAGYANIVLKDNAISLIREQVILKNIIKDNTFSLNKLYQFSKVGYAKIEAYNSSLSPNLTYFLFISNNINGKQAICGIIVDARTFVRQVLAPKIQALVEDRFIISVTNDHRDEVVYISERNPTHSLNRVKSLWLLPNFKLGIIYKGKTIEQLVRERTYTNFALILLLDVLLLTGTWYVFRSIKTQIQLAQMRADFISNVSHEIRTPLALISVYIETILLGRLKGDKLQEYYQIIHQETNRLTGIVNKILNFSRIEEKKYKYTFVSLNLNDIVDEVMKRYEYHLKNRNFEIEVKLDEDLPMVRGDRESIYEVIMNLIDNAIKYSKEERFLSVTSAKENNNVVIEIEDKGIGIPESQQKYVFDKFFRVSDGEVQNVRGSGLGLAIVKQIMDSHNAVISLTSIQGKGSKFKLVFKEYVEDSVKNESDH